MGNVVRKERCPECAETGKDNSSDNLAVYDDGSTYCFACSYYTKGEGVEEQEDRTDNITYEDIPNRGLTKRICEHFGYGIIRNNGKTKHAAQYYDNMGKMVAYKLRDDDKNMSVVGKLDKGMLFGKHLYNPTPKLFITITEGEIDALSVAEIQGKQFPVVSIPNGAQGAAAAIKNNLSWLSGFKYVVLCFDMDDAGRKAVEECAPLFEVGKVRVVKLPLKDANEMLVAGKGVEFKNALWNATTYRPDSILTMDEILDKGLKRPEQGLSWPWQCMTDATYGIRNNEMYMIGAGSGIGKSQFLIETSLHLVQTHNIKVGMIYLEQTPHQTLLKLAGLMLNKRLHVPSADWDEDLIREALATVKDNIFIYNHFGAADIDTVLGKIRYFVKALGCQVILLDHITALAALMQDERKGLDEAMAKLGGLVHELDCTFFLVSHLAKPMGGESYEEGRRVAPSSFRGSQSLQYWASYMLGLERNKLSDGEDRNVMTVRVLKDRFSGESDGLTFKLRYDKMTGRLIEDDAGKGVI